MRDSMFTAVVARKWRLAEDYHAVEIQAKHAIQLPPFDNGAVVDLARHARSDVVRSHPVWRIPSRHDAFILGVRQASARHSEPLASEFSWDKGDEVCVGTPRDTPLIADGNPRYILFSAGVGVIAIAGAANRLAAVGQYPEIYNFARTPERAVFKKELDDLQGSARIRHKFGLNTEEIANAISHALSPTQANTQVICSGPPSFMELVERLAGDWVYQRNIQKIILGQRSADR
ncbi:oxidoreductase [Paraburkholderia sp. C35]|uniref:oxidoreductase n=1 Tax=Paraburkholderia sp. C35 TaxID=2126993 RepID=UPI000D68992E|nr:oxidoreductase [Paraburkholderia sp. C35]